MRVARRTTGRPTAVAALLTGLLLTACSSGSGSGASPATTAAGNTSAAATSGAATASGSAPTSAGTPASSAVTTSAPAANGKVVHLTFWSWLSNIDKIVAVWNSGHPDIQVSVNSQTQGDALVTKLLTADKAGNPPDLFQAEYQALPSLVSSGVAADITKDIAPIKGKFTDAAWNNVSFNGAAYAIPQDFGPMMMYYRADLFTQYGLAVPTTWAQYADEAATLRTKAPGHYLTTFSAGDPGWFSGLAAQAGAQWWSTSGTTWKVGINDAATKKVAQYWGDLVAKGDIQSQPMYTPAWNKAMNDGTLLSWPSAVWGPGVLAGIAPATAGKWAMAPLPAWNAGEKQVGFWGGSSTGIAAKSKNKAAAVQFASWLNTDAAAVSLLITKGTAYPASIDGQKAPELSAPPAFMPNQPTFFQQAATISSTAKGFTWGPDVNVAYAAYRDAFGKAIQSKSSFVTALDAIQNATVADMKKAGFTVAGS
jgi:multiple sugar transport system substrate-binding protein